jgi:hypothetical protein
MNIENNINDALVDQVIEGIETLLNISDDNTEREIQKLTEQLNRAEQQKLLDDWAPLYFFDVEKKYRTDEYLIKLFFLSKLNNETVS